MRSLWKGALSFGLVNIPVRLYTATQRKDVKFNYLHSVCHTPVKYEKHCPVCDREVPQEEIVLGYEYEKGRYVILNEDDFESIPVDTTKSVEIVDFVDLAEIDPVYFDKSYYLEPGVGGTKPYHLLRQAMQDTGKIAVAKVVIRTKESLAVVRVKDRALVLETMFYPDEIRSTSGLEGLEEEPKIQENEFKMAVTLIQNLSSPFDPGKYSNEYREALMQLIRSRVEGEAIAIPERREAAKVIDLMTALRESLKATEP
jgi:DNA end-binding protein Ku